MGDNLLFQKALNQTEKNTSDIQELALSVTRLTTLVESSEKRRDGDMQVFREAATGITRLNERIGGLVGIEKDIAVLTGFISEQKADARALRHDVNGLTNTLQGIPILSEKISEVNKTLATHEAKIEALETWRDRIEGGKATANWIVRAFWAVFGTGIMAGLYFLAQLIITQKGGPTIGGE